PRRSSSDFAFVFILADFIFRCLRYQLLTHLTQALFGHRFCQIAAVKTMRLSASARAEPIAYALLPAYSKTANPTQSWQARLDERFDADSDQSCDQDYLDDG